MSHPPAVLGYCTYYLPDARTALGIVTSAGVVPASALGLEWRGLDSVDALIRDDREIELASAALDHAQSAADPLPTLESLKLAPCLTQPQKILMVGLNYRRHAAEVNKPLPTVPMMFAKFNNALAASGQTVKLPAKYAEKFDYEAELVIVIGRDAYDVAEENALEYVFGYCTGNDLSARDLQNATSQYLMGKGIDGFAPIGPWVTPARLAGNPDDLTIRCEVNGSEVQSSNTNDLIFDCAQIVSFCSRVMTLKPGDLIFTGTPEGVVAGKPANEQRWLRAGDRMITEIEGLGSLRTVFA